MEPDPAKSMEQKHAHRHLIQSPYLPPLLPILHPHPHPQPQPKEEVPRKKTALRPRLRAQGSTYEAEQARSRFEREESKRPTEPSSTQALDSPRNGWATSNPASPNLAQDAFSPSRSGSVSESLQHKEVSKDEKKLSRDITKRWKSALKDMFKKDEEVEAEGSPITMKHWTDEDY